MIARRLRRSPSPQWDTKIAHWLKQAQSRAMATSSEAKKPGGRDDAPARRCRWPASHPARSLFAADAPSPGTSSKSPPKEPKAGRGARDGRGGGRVGGGGGKSTMSAASIKQGLAKLKSDLLELENYIPWNAVNSSWSGKRAGWARRTKDCKDTQATGKQLLMLEQAIVPNAFEGDWPNQRSEWQSELHSETNPDEVRARARGAAGVGLPRA